MTVQTVYYFNEDAQPVHIGQEIKSADEAAYSTIDLDDPIWQPAPTGTVKKIINGRLTFNRAPWTLKDAITYSKRIRDAKIAKGILVRGLYKVGGELKEEWTERFKIDANIKNDMIVLCVFSFFQKVENFPYKVAPDVYLVFKNSSELRYLIYEGIRFSKEIYAREEALISNLKDMPKLTENTKSYIDNFWNNVDRTADFYDERMLKQIPGFTISDLVAGT